MRWKTWTCHSQEGSDQEWWITKLMDHFPQTPFSPLVSLPFPLSSYGFIITINCNRVYFCVCIVWLIFSSPFFGVFLMIFRKKLSGFLPRIKIFPGIKRIAKSTFLRVYIKFSLRRLRVQKNEKRGERDDDVIFRVLILTFPERWNSKRWIGENSKKQIDVSFVLHLDNVKKGGEVVLSLIRERARGIGELNVNWVKSFFWFGSFI